MKGLKAEYLKTKNTPTMWFTIACSMFIPLVIFLIYLFKHQYFIPQEGVNAWMFYFQKHYHLLITFFPFYVILSAPLNLNIEHKSHSWKKLLILPVHRICLFLDKGLFLFFQTVFSLLLFAVTILILGVLIGIIYPDLNMFNYFPDIVSIGLFLAHVLISSLTILAIHYTMSVFFNNTIISIIIGIIAIIVSEVISKWKYAIYSPYSFLRLFFNYYQGNRTADIYWGLSFSEWLSIGLGIVIIVIGAWFFNRKQLK